MTGGEFAFVDRIEEMDQIRGSMKAAKNGKGRLILIRGEAGSGKTRLLQEAVAQAEKLGFNVGFGNALPESAATYHPWREALEGLGLSGILEEDASPELLDPELRQARLFEQVAIGLSKSSRTHPILLAIDDLQWADSSSLDLMRYVARNTRELDVLLMGAYRSEEVESRLYLKEALKNMQLEELFIDTDLVGLSREYLNDLSESFIGPHALSGGFIDLLWRETQGNPLFVREVLFRLEEDGFLAVKGMVKRLARPLEELALPERVRDVIRARLDRIPKEDRELLDAAATCGSRFTASFVAKVAGEEEGRVLNGLRNMSRVHGLLRNADSGFTFDHPAVQEVLYDGVPTETRQNYHKEAAEWLELAGGPVEDIAEHYYRARDRRAVATLREAASAARAKYANEEAIRLYLEALELEEDEQERRRVFESLGTLFNLVGEYERSIESYGHALDLADDICKRAEIKVRIGEAHMVKGDYDDALRFCAEALDSVEGQESREEARALNQIGQVQWFMGEVEKALESYREGAVIAEKIGEHPIHASCLGNIGIIQREQGDYDGAIESHRKNLDIERESGNQKAIAGSLHNISHVYFGKGDYDVALDYLGRAVEISERIGHLRFLAKHLNNIGNVHLGRGSLDEARRHFAKSFEIKRKIGDQEGIASALLNIGVVCQANEDYNKALEYFNESKAILEKIGVRWWLGESCCYIAEAYLGMADFDKATEFADLALSLSTETGRRQDIGHAWALFGNIYRDQNLWRESIVSYEKSLVVFREIGKTDGEADACYEMGLMWKKKGDLSKARKHLDVAAHLYEEMKAEGALRKAREAYESVDVGKSSDSHGQS
jgi:tetratricopeptide (TPR) repeat protein